MTPGQAVYHWNAHHPVGTVVDYTEVRGVTPARRTATRSEAWVLSGHSAVVTIDGKAGCVHLAHCDVVRAS